MLARGSEPWVLAPLIILMASSGFLVLTRTPLLLAVSTLSGLAFLFFLAFFRDPPRPVGKGVVSPADGRVLTADPEAGTVSIYMGLRDVHVNRSPLAGTVSRMDYRRGAHVPAFRKESERNERMEIRIETRYGRVTLTQVAGLVARRIVPYIIEGDRVRRGQRIGIIRFGSRVELTLPPTCTLTVREGDRVLAGLTTLAEVAL